jgi:hypothetical protein
MPDPSFTSKFVSQPLPHPLWPALVNPHRFAEVRKEVAKDPHPLLSARGEKWQESAMHWVGMSDPGSWIDLVAVGGDPNALDKLGRTPLDWVNDRLFLGAMASHQRLGEPSRDRIRVATTKHAPAIWSTGGRPGSSPHSTPAVKLWIEAGLWDLVSLAKDEPQWWSGWEGGLHALHAWVSMADRVGAEALLAEILSVGLNVDAPDGEGHSALWVAVDQWLENPTKAGPSRAAISYLRTHGADPDLDQGSGAPSSLPMLRGVSEQLQSAIGAAISF